MKILSVAAIISLIGTASAGMANPCVRDEDCDSYNWECCSVEKDGKIVGECTFWEKCEKRFPPTSS